MNHRGSYSIVVCGGTALNALHLVLRAIKDVEIVALLDVGNQLIDPAPMPEDLLAAAKEVAYTLKLREIGSTTVQAAGMADFSD